MFYSNIYTEAWYCSMFVASSSPARELIQIIFI